MFKTPEYYQNFNFVLKSMKSEFLVLTFVVLFLELIIAQCSAYAHFKEFFVRKNMIVPIKLSILLGEQLWIDFYKIYENLPIFYATKHTIALVLFICQKCSIAHFKGLKFIFKMSQRKRKSDDQIESYSTFSKKKR